ncbi:hypothetical protein [Massilia sp. HP4]|uniref:hypothetical protein n=1 Tax=Massilia sp. HP4 TaxID=2562316 RepID=UPI0010C0B955|nr:hypothetical protein [Massilia sp. HP4]
MPDRPWYLPLEGCTTLDEIGALWHDLLEVRRVAPAYPVPRYADAVLLFAGMSSLPPRLRLGALLAWGSAFDTDLRLALGALHEAVLEVGQAWPDAVAASVSDNGGALLLETSDPWLSAFVAGRMAGLRETFVHDGVRPGHWTAAFWNRFLEMACRHGDVVAVRHALGQGADPHADGSAAIAAAAAGPDAHEPANADAAQQDYLEVLASLLEHDADARHALLDIAFPAAAAANNVAALAWLKAQGVDIDHAGSAALAAAASQLAIEAFEWLLEQGADTCNPELLAAAASSLDETMVELALDAGAGVDGSALPAFLAALDSSPRDLYSVEAEFFDMRLAILALLQRRGLRPDAAELAAAVHGNARRGKLMDALSAPATLTS